MSELPVRRIALLLEYDGTGFSGSQSQPNARTVQDELERALAAFEVAGTSARARCSLAGRTDAGVHARGQVAAFDTDRPQDARTIRRAMNYHLPEDLAARAAAEVPASFDPRRDAVLRRYRYRVVAGRPRSPLARRDAWHRERALDVERMADAAARLPLGGERRDWSAFAGRLDDGVSPLRTLARVAVEAGPDGAIDVTMEAQSFLPHQVRRTVGALVEVGRGAITPEEFGALIDGAPGSVGPAAPAHGLVLESVSYPEGLVDWSERPMAERQALSRPATAATRDGETR